MISARPATVRSAPRAGALRLLLAAALTLPLAATLAQPARAQWGDSYDDRPRDGYAPRRRSRDAYYREDDGYARSPRRAAPQEAPRQFYWPWEDQPRKVEPRAEPTYRQPRARAPAANSEGDRPSRRPPTRSAPVVTAPKPAAPKTEQTVQIAVFGDFLADYLSRGLGDVFADKADVAVIDRTKGDSGIVRKDVVDWPKAAEDYLKTNPKVGFAVVMLGANDRQPIREGDQTLDPLTDRWREVYGGRVDALVKVFSDRKIALVWVGTPPMRSETLTRDLASINDLARERVAKAGATYVDIWPGFTDDRNHYTADGPDLDGQNAKLRTSDGVHFTHAGARKLAHFVDVELKRLMGNAAPVALEPPAAAVPAVPAATPDATAPKLDDVAAIDRQITAMLPSLPEPPGVPALPVKPAAGPVVPLGRAELSPGGTLTSGRPHDGDATGTVERTLQRGAPPMPQPGRADDFRWPPS
ncbi:DUF459 domain-containing protein [uncultured Methylobacterium sp.]|uniref:SGNH/GDSL hydrolase family protein n=1 Tax=uncultured Methylobacterium sp. TaxID=157278 RepID=UPI0035CBD879